MKACAKKLTIVEENANKEEEKFKSTSKKNKRLVIQELLICVCTTASRVIYHIEKCELHYRQSRSNRRPFIILEYSRTERTSLPSDIVTHSGLPYKMSLIKKKTFNMFVPNANDVTSRLFTYFCLHFSKRKQTILPFRALIMADSILRLSEKHTSSHTSHFYNS